MRKFKTAEKNRTNYVYYTAEGKPIVITPGMVGEDGKAVTESLITMLHDWDDEDVNAERREEYHCPVHYENYHDGDGDDADDRNPFLEDETYNPLQQILTSIADEEHSVRMEKLKVALSELTDKQKDTIIKKFYRKMTNVQIAAEEGVSEAAMLYWIMFLALVLVGAVKIIITQFELNKGQKIVTAFSIVLSILAVLFLAMTREAYAVTIAFFLFVVKGILLFKHIKSEK